MIKKRIPIFLFGVFLGVLFVIFYLQGRKQAQMQQEIPIQQNNR